MASSNVTDVLVVGAGPTGLVSALVLVQNGVSVRIIDKSPRFALGQRGVGLAPRTLEAFKLIGVLDDILSTGTKADIHIKEYDAEGKAVKDYPIMETLDPTPDMPYPNFMGLGQDSTTAILRKHLAKYGVNVELATELVSLEQDDSAAIATLKSGAADGSREEKLCVKFVMGADGGHGITRKLVGVKFVGESNKNIRMVIGDIEEFSGLDRTYFHRFKSGAGNMCMLRPIPERDGAFFLGVTGPDLDFQRAKQDVEYLRQYICDFTKHDIKIGKMTGLDEWRLNVRVADSFRVGRVLITGDAAHVHSPTGGQGLNSGVMDAMNASWKIALVCKDLAPPVLLDSYDAERRPVINEMILYTSRLAHATYKAANATEAAYRRELSGRQLGINCRWSAIVRDELLGDAKPVEPVDAYDAGPGPLRAGDRAPDAPGMLRGKPATLFEFFRATRHTVLVLDPMLRVDASAVVAQVLVVRPSEPSGEETDAFVDVQGCVARAYGVQEGVHVAIVRPDGVVGALLAGTEGVQAYFELVFGKGA